MTLSLAQLNTLAPDAALQALHGLYEHSDWIAEKALAQRPFTSAAHLKQAMVQVLRSAGREAQLTLIRAHPELAGKAMLGNALTAASTDEQSRAGLTHCCILYTSDAADETRPV
jgi:N-carbamoyl-L-amino-acid hydrolase